MQLFSILNSVVVLACPEQSAIREGNMKIKKSNSFPIKKAYYPNTLMNSILSAYVSTRV